MLYATTIIIASEILLLVILVISSISSMVLLFYPIFLFYFFFCNELSDLKTTNLLLKPIEIPKSFYLSVGLYLPQSLYLITSANAS